jgi:hypothetical protein
LEATILDNGTGDLSLTVGDILVSDTGFTAPETGFILTDSDTDSGGATTAGAWVSNTDAVFAETTSIGTVGPLSTGGTSGQATLKGTASSPYSLTLAEGFTATTSPVEYSADASITATPEPASMLLFGTGLLGLAFAVAFSQRERLRLTSVS